MIEIITPAGFEHFFRDLADLFEAGVPDPADLESLSASYGLFMDQTWVPDMMERHGLNSPFG
jgi:hypothetical protein